MTDSATPTSRHTMRVTLDHESICLMPVCHEPKGAACRMMCPEGCEAWCPAHEHALESIDFCNAVEWLTAGDVECQCGSPDPVPMHDGMPIEVEWNGDGYTWSPVKVPVVAL